MYSLKRKFYESLPPWAQRPVRLVPFALVAGKAYRRAWRRAAAMDRASPEQIRAFQQEALGKILRFASEQVPAYRSLRSVVDRLPPLEALRAFPLVSKHDIQIDLKRYLPRDFASIPHYECTTGGTSGNQLRLYLDDNSHSIEMGFMHRNWSRVGYTPRCRKATFRGVNLATGNHPRLWRPNPIYNEWQFSPYHINTSTLPQYIEALYQYRPHYLHGYPSAISLVARYLRSEGRSLSDLGIRAVLLGSEGVTSDQRAQIEQAFDARVFSWYGHSERLILAGECEETSVYHHFPDYGILEMVRDDGEPIDEAGERGELVGTGLWNYSLPLIRYRTEDRARLRETHCSCGRSFQRFDRVEGRWKQEYVVGKTGSHISPAALNIHGDAFDHVLRYQYHQRRAGVLELRVVPGPDFQHEDIVLLQQAYRRKLGEELTVEVKLVEDIPLTPRGKLRRLIQELPSEIAGV